VYRNGELVGAAAFENRDGLLSFFGQERMDYCDFLVAADLDSDCSARVISALLEAAVESTERFRRFELRKIPQTSRWRQPGGDGFYGVKRSSIDAPAMNMAVVSEKLRKKSLRRHENGMKRAGRLESRTSAEASVILPRLDAFFQQHVLRWSDTGTPSLFTDEANRDFYRRLVVNFDAAGVVRFTELLLDDVLVAAHLGFLFDGVFTWYKPSFDIALARMSPGEVLLKRVLERAQEEGAHEFDFTIGDEPYKYRFATDVRTVADYYITRNPASALLMRARGSIGRSLRSAGLRRSA
jgi:CelD/BcsL family acetyltransferase involved in cellulose biosynthesis